MGYRKLDEVDVPKNFKVTNPSDPYPVTIFNEEKTIPDNKIGKYMNDEFNYYLEIYENNKQFGFPFKDWTEMPRWLIHLHKTFSKLEDEYQSYLTNRGMQTK
jgi:hypothetical protein